MSQTASPSAIHAAIKSVWNDKTDELFRQDQSHWRGVGRWADDQAWLDIGRQTRSSLEDAYRLLNCPPAFEGATILEWGPGGGANLFAFKDTAKRLIGVDISQKNLIETMRILKAENASATFDPLLLKADIEEAVKPFRDSVDVFISTAVFQHFPSRQYGADVLAALRRCCKTDAVGVIQIRYDNGFSKYRGITDISEYERNFVTANAYQIEEFWDLLQSSGFKPIAIASVISRINYATYLISAA